MDKNEKFTAALASSSLLHRRLSPPGGAIAHAALGRLALAARAMRVNELSSRLANPRLANPRLVNPIDGRALSRAKLVDGDVAADQISRFHPSGNARAESEPRGEFAAENPLDSHAAHALARGARIHTLMTERLATFFASSAGAHEIKNNKTHIPMRPATDFFQPASAGSSSGQIGAASSPGHANDDLVIRDNSIRSPHRLGQLPAAKVAPSVVSPVTGTRGLSPEARAGVAAQIGSRINGPASRLAAIAGDEPASSSTARERGGAAFVAPSSARRASADTPDRGGEPRFAHGDREVIAALRRLVNMRAVGPSSPHLNGGSTDASAARSGASPSPSIVINSSPTIVVQAGHGGDLSRQALDALRRHRRELFDEMRRELRVRMRTDF
ncbi:MAG: hypothetical protein ACREP6_00110 [Candidatus Binataceae bacterium]